MRSLSELPLIFFKGITVIIFVATLLLFATVLLDPFKMQPKFRDQKRTQDLTQFHTFLTEYLNSPLVLSSYVQTDIHQIGTATSGCALETEYCSIPSDTCMNLNHILPDPSLDLPVDPLLGSVAKTGYAVVLEAPGTVKFIACHGENSLLEEGRAFEKEAVAYEEAQNDKNN